MEPEVAETEVDVFDQLIEDINNEPNRTLINPELKSKIENWAEQAVAQYPIHRLVPTKFQVKMYSLILCKVFEQIPEGFVGVAEFGIDYLLDSKSVTAPRSIVVPASECCGGDDHCNG